jgi:flagellar basal-body rod protein FlgB
MGVGAMDLNKLPLFSMISQRMNWLGERQKVLAQNVANADTPNYAPRDLKEVDFRKMVSSGGGSHKLQPAATDAHHLTGAGGSAKASQVKPKPTETTVSGNSVSLETELMKIADTGMDYQLVTNLYRKQLGLFRLVLSRGGGQG